MTPLSSILRIDCRAMGKKTKGRKRHILTDTIGLMLVLIIQSAGVQDRDGAPEVLRFARFRFRWLRRLDHRSHTPIRHR